MKFGRLRVNQRFKLWTLILSLLCVYFHNLGHSITCICNPSFFIVMYLLPVKSEMHFRDIRKKNVPEINDL